MLQNRDSVRLALHDASADSQEHAADGGRAAVDGPGRVLDIGIAQNPMFDAVPPAWGRFLPAHAAMRVLVDAAFTPGFDETAALVVALAWLIALTGVAASVFRRVMTR